MIKVDESQVENGIDRLPPQDLNAEKAVLGAALQDAGAVSKAVETLKSTYFYESDHEQIFKAIETVFDRREPIDILTVGAELQGRGKLDQVGGNYYLTELVAQTPSAANVEYHALIVFEKWYRRRYIRLAGQLQNVCYDGFSNKQVSEILSELSQMGGDVRNGNVYFRQFKKLNDAFSAREKIPSVVEGVVPARSLSIWYSSPGKLKSNLLFDMCVSIATGSRWLPDQPGKGNFLGFVVNVAPILWIDIDNGEEVVAERLAAFARAREVVDAPIYWLSFPTPALSAVRGLSDLIVCAKKIGPGLIVIDNLLRVAGVRDENSSEIDTAMANLRQLVESTGSAVAVIHHRRKDSSSFGREGDSIRGHSSIEGAVDAAFLLKREEKSDVVTVINTKARRRPIDSFSALWTFELEEDGETLKSARFFRTEMQDMRTKVQTELKARVLKALAVSPLNTRAILKVVGGRSENVRNILKDLLRDGKIKKESGKRRAEIYSRTV